MAHKAPHISVLDCGRQRIYRFETDYPVSYASYGEPEGSQWTTADLERIIRGDRTIQVRVMRNCDGRLMGYYVIIDVADATYGDKWTDVNNDAIAAIGMFAYGVQDPPCALIRDDEISLREFLDPRGN